MESRRVTLPRSSSPQNSESRSSSRPVSLYDNIRTNGNTLERNGRASFREHPSQAHFLNTTVPQNITALNIAGRHTPTRTSLRHSRMIVMSKTGPVPKKSLPRVFKFYKLAKALVGLQTLLGAALSFLSLWLCIWTPNLRTRDNPYWSALPLLISGIIGLILLYCCRKEYPGMKRNYCVFTMKVLSISLSAIAATACFISCTFAILHLISLRTMSCSPANELNATCICKTFSATNSTIPIRSYHYIDLSCPEVDNILSILLIFCCSTNAIAGIISVWYVYLHWSSRYTYTYSKVRTKEETPIVFSNT